MKIAIVKETAKLEKRVAATPDIVKKYIDLGFEVGFEKNAGVNSYYSDESYISAGAKVYNNVEDLISESDIILKVNNVYTYFANESYPFFPRCFKGQANLDFITRN